VTPLLDTGSGSHEISVPLTAPAKLSANQKLVVFVGGQGAGTGTTTVAGVLVSYFPAY
jgi:hypothetical protein